MEIGRNFLHPLTERRFSDKLAKCNPFHMESTPDSGFGADLRVLGNKAVTRMSEFNSMGQ